MTQIIDMIAITLALKRKLKKLVSNSSAYFNLQLIKNVNLFTDDGPN